MGATADELRQDIEAKRSELGDDLEALGQHVAPAQIVERKRAEYADRIRDGVDTIKHALGGDPPPPPSPGTPRAGGSITEQPALLAGVSLVAGMVVGAFLSRRRARRRARRS